MVCKTFYSQNVFTEVGVEEKISKNLNEFDKEI